MKRICSILMLALASTTAFAQKDTKSPAPDATAQAEAVQKMTQEVVDAINKAKDASGAINHETMMKNLADAQARMSAGSAKPATLTLVRVQPGKETPYKQKIMDGHRECIDKNKGPGGIPTPGTVKCDARFRELMENPFWRYVVTDVKGTAISCPANLCKLQTGSAVVIRAEGPEAPNWTGDCRTSNLVPGGKASGKATCTLAVNGNLTVGVK